MSPQRRAVGGGSRHLVPLRLLGFRSVPPAYPRSIVPPKSQSRGSSRVVSKIWRNLAGCQAQCKTKGRLGAQTEYSPRLACDITYVRTHRSIELLVKRYWEFQRVVVRRTHSSERATGGLFVSICSGQAPFNQGHDGSDADFAIIVRFHHLQHPPTSPRWREGIIVFAENVRLGFPLFDFGWFAALHELLFLFFLVDNRIVKTHCSSRNPNGIGADSQQRTPSRGTFFGWKSTVFVHRIAGLKRDRPGTKREWNPNRCYVRIVRVLILCGIHHICKFVLADLALHLVLHLVLFFVRAKSGPHVGTLQVVFSPAVDGWRGQ
ncbi:hypothetical protein DFJ73DRAFT_832875 [Zopfochytrium polystomum]|nr:hypothetical protein DFJ73DRAFT_832875 [Zopfochytrium polystomum]